MNESEIVSMYRSAADPRVQIRILADLNATTPGVIREVLRRRGLEVPVGTRKRGRPSMCGNPEGMAPSREWVMRVCCGGSKLDCKKAVDMYLAGYSDSEIAEAFDLSPRTVRGWRADRKLPTLYKWR